MFVPRSSFTRRHFFLGAASIAFWNPLSGVLRAESSKATASIVSVDRGRILRAANGYLNAAPITVTSTHCPRSAGGLHDYYTEAEDWWPDADRPGGPYIRQAGFANPDRFHAHSEALIRLSLIVPALTAAWMLTGRQRYAEQAAAHLRAWFIDPLSRMNPNLQYTDSIFGVAQGRASGIIDTIQLVETARAASFLLDGGIFSLQDHVALRGWFHDYLQWLTTSTNGLAARDAQDLHGCSWAMQVAEFARFTADSGLQQLCRDRFLTVLLPNQIAADGHLPFAVAGHNPYGASLFTLDMLSTTAQILTTQDDNLFAFQLPDGRGLRSATAYMQPFIADKKLWPFPYDAAFFDDLPVRPPSLLFAGLAYKEPSYIALWKTLNPDPRAIELLRTNPIRQPILWI